MQSLIQEAPVTAPALGFTVRWQERQAIQRRRNHQRQSWILFVITGGIAAALLVALGISILSVVKEPDQLLIFSVYRLFLLLMDVEAAGGFLSMVMKSLVERGAIGCLDRVDRSGLDGKCAVVRIIQAAHHATEDCSMKITAKTFLFLFLGLFLAAAAPGKALAAAPVASRLADQFVIGDSYTLKSGDTLDGNLWVLGGNVSLESGSRVNGNIWMAGGNLHVAGEVNGNISAAGGLVEVGSTAVVHGRVAVTGASFDRSEGAVIDGGVTTEPNGPFQFSNPNGVNIPNIQIRLAPLWDAIGFFFRAFLMAALAILVVMFWPKQTGRTAKAVVTQPLITGSLGLVTVFVAPLVVLVMVVTIILIPVSLLGILLLGIMIAFGWIAIGMEVGVRLEQAFKTEWALPVTAGLGTFLLTLVIDGIGRLVPCVGWLAPSAVGLMGLGAVLLTRFGSQDYPTYMPSSGRPNELINPSSLHFTGIPGQTGRTCPTTFGSETH